MLDYDSIWVKFAAFFEVPEDDRQEVINHISREVKEGFDVLTRISEEEIEHVISSDLFNAIKTDLEVLLSFSVFQGYILYLISNNRDPFIKNVTNDEKTSELGSVWLENYNKDKLASLISEIDPTLSLYLEKAKEARMNQLFLAHPEVEEKKYKDVATIEQYMNWVCYQGYILGMLEEKLNKNG